MEIHNITAESDPHIWALLQPPEARDTNPFGNAPAELYERYHVVQSYPKTWEPCIVSTHDSFKEARKAKDLENMGRDYSTVVVAIECDDKFLTLNHWGTVGGELELKVEEDSDSDEDWDWQDEYESDEPEFEEPSAEEYNSLLHEFLNQ